jgi:hypothetical protein
VSATVRAPVSGEVSGGAASGSPRIAVLYVMFEEYDFLARQLDAVNGQTFLDFTFVCVSGHQSDEARIRATLDTARVPTVLLKRDRDNGPAGGFWDGEAWCLSEGYDVVVHVESDCFPTSPRLMERLAHAIREHSVAVPVCTPDGIPMGWRWCAVRAEVLRAVGLSYRELYFLTEDVYFYRNVTRRHRPAVLTDVSVYHPPVIEKHAFTDKYLVSFPYLWGRNHMLFPITLVRTHRDLRDALNFIGYFASVCVYALHLHLRGKRASASAIVRGIVDGLMFRESRILKDRIEAGENDYPVRETSSFTPDLVLDKQGFDIGPGAIAAALGSRGKRVLLRRTSQIVLIVCLFLAEQLAVTDGDRTWLLKDRARETWDHVLLFYMVFGLSVVLALPALGIGLLWSLRSHATRVPTRSPFPGVVAPLPR